LTRRPTDPGGWLAPIDGLRGVSILMVITAHVYRPGWERIEGRMGVTIFFVLSGFLITRLLLREERDRGAIDLRAFYIRRAFRLFPLYYFVLAVYCVLLLGLRSRPDLHRGFVGALPFYLFYLQEIPFFMAHQAPPFYQSWSLGIEEKFYFVWPLLAFRFVTRPIGRIGVAAVAFALLSAAHFSPPGRYVFPYASICVGCLAALVDDRPGVRERMRGLLAGPGAWVALVALVAVHGALAYGPQWLADAARVAYPLPVAAFMIASLESPAIGRFLSLGPLVELGRLSYGIYLVHLLVRNAVEGVFGHLPGGLATSGAVVYLATVASSAVVARILSAWLETPLRQLGRRIADARSPQAAVVPVVDASA
jgi:peptidoglycan/LPS O-acetylase OafA/YrhL